MSDDDEAGQAAGEEDREAWQRGAHTARCALHAVSLCHGVAVSGPPAPCKVFAEGAKGLCGLGESKQAVRSRSVPARCAGRCEPHAYLPQSVVDAPQQPLPVYVKRGCLHVHFGRHDLDVHTLAACCLLAYRVIDICAPAGERQASEERHTAWPSRGGEREAVQKAGERGSDDENMEHSTMREGKEAVHRGIRCDLCGMMPIRGIRYESKVCCV